MVLKVFKKIKTFFFKTYELQIIGLKSIFSNEAFTKSLLNKPSKEVFLTNHGGLQQFCCINIGVLKWKVSIYSLIEAAVRNNTE